MVVDVTAVNVNPQEVLAADSGKIDSDLSNKQKDNICDRGAEIIRDECVNPSTTLKKYVLTVLK